MKNKQIFIALLFVIPVFCIAQTNNQCKDGQHWVRPYYRNAYTRSDGTYISASNVTGHCKSFSCSYIFWNQHIKETAPKNWPHKTEKFKSWKQSEIERFFDAVDDVPEKLWSKKIEELYRAFIEPLNRRRLLIQQLLQIKSLCCTTRHLIKKSISVEF